jgi:CxxC motif-containing protein (DUF1111 family)
MDWPNLRLWSVLIRARSQPRPEEFVAMTSLASMHRVVGRPTRALVWATVVASSLGFLTAVSTGDDTPNSSQAGAAASPQDQSASKSVEAPAAFDNKTNGFEDQAAFDHDSDKFQEVEAIKDGLGPVYNATSCVGCHQNPVTGSSSQTSEIRAGRRTFNPNDPSPKKVRFEEPPGGSVIQQRAIDPAIQETVPPEDDVRTLRMSNTVLGNGFVEVIPDEEILRIRNEQRRWGMEGFAVVVPVPVEAKKSGGPNMIDAVFVERLGRFGWKCQEASLLNFSAGAYVAEMGVTSPLQPVESTSNGRDVSKFDTVPDPEDHFIADDDPKKVEHLFGSDVESFTRFMRSTKAPPRDPAVVATQDVIEGEKLFRNNSALGCAVCHHPDYKTPIAGTPILTLGGARGSDMATVPDALGGKVIHPYSDFLLHDVGTGDGIAQTQHADIPARGQKDLRKIPDELRTREDIGRVDASTEKGDRRLLSHDTGVDQRTANKIRTAPLWGLRARPQLMHDGMSLTIDGAIRRHNVQAEGVRLKYEALSSDQKRQLLAFLNSL